MGCHATRFEESDRLDCGFPHLPSDFLIALHDSECRRVQHQRVRRRTSANEDIGLNKTITLSDRCRLSLRFQLFNAFNRHRFAGPNTTIGDPKFGTVPAENLNGQSPRVGQLGARFTF